MLELRQKLLYTTPSGWWWLWWWLISLFRMVDLFKLGATSKARLESRRAPRARRWLKGGDDGSQALQEEDGVGVHLSLPRLPAHPLLCSQLQRNHMNKGSKTNRELFVYDINVNCIPVLS